MRILFISDVYFPRVNGVSTSIITFRRELELLGHEVVLIAPDYGELTDDEQWIYRVPSRVVWLDPEDRLMKMSGVIALEDKVRAFNPDVIHIQTPFVAFYAGLRLARRLQVPTVLSCHTHFEEYLFCYIRFLPRPWLKWVARYFTRHQCSKPDAVVVPSTPFLEVVRHYGVRRTLAVIATGIDLDRFKAGDGGRFRAKHGIDPARPVLLFVGRMVHEKNIDFLLRVVCRVRAKQPDVLFLMAGEGPARGYLEEKGEQMGLAGNLKFVGNIYTMQELLDCYSSGEVFIFASRTETQGLVLLEAMALGTPVVSTAVMGTRDILAPEKGALVADEEEAQFADQVLRVLQDPALAGRLGEEGKAYVEEWSATGRARMMARLYTDIIPTVCMHRLAIEEE